MGDFRFSLRHGNLDDSEIDFSVANVYEPFIYSNGTKYAFGVFVPNPNFNGQNVSDDQDWDGNGNYRYALAKIDLNLEIPSPS